MPAFLPSGTIKSALNTLREVWVKTLGAALDGKMGSGEERGQAFVAAFYMEANILWSLHEIVIILATGAAPLDSQ